MAQGPLRVCVLSGPADQPEWRVLGEPASACGGPRLCCEPTPYLWVLCERGAGSQGARQVLGETLSSQCHLLCLAARDSEGFWVCAVGEIAAGVLGRLLLCFLGDSLTELAPD